MFYEAKEEIQLAAATGSVLLAKDNDLELVIPGKNTGPGDRTQDVGAATLEEGLGTLVLQNLLERVQ